MRKEKLRVIFVSGVLWVVRSCLFWINVRISLPDILENALIAMLDFLGLESAWIKFLKEVNPENEQSGFPSLGQKIVFSWNL